MAYFAPTDLKTAVTILQENTTKVIAGCTDFFPSQKSGDVHSNILDLTRIKGLRDITKNSTSWHIGATTTWSDILSANLPPYFDGLKLAAREVGSVQIQNSATIAGNICNASPAADGIPPLLSLDATVEISSINHQRQIPLSDFVLGVRHVDLQHHELVSAINVPLKSEKAKSNFLKLGTRTHLVISIVMVAVTIIFTNDIIDDICIAVGSCSPVAKRLPDLENFLVGKSKKLLEDEPLSKDLFSQITPISDVRATADFRRSAVPELCRRAILQIPDGKA